MADVRPETRDAVVCPHFGACGGCSRLDRAYDVEMGEKERAFAALVRREPSLAGAEVLPLLAAREPHLYRTSMKVPFGVTPRGPVCGFFRPGTHHIVDLRVCAVQHPLLTALLTAARRHVRALSVPVYREDDGRGLLRHLIGRVAPGTGQMLAGLVTRTGGTAHIRRLAGALLEELGPRGLVGVVENVNDRRGSAVLGAVTQPVCGSPYLMEEQDGLRVRTSLTSFAQANTSQASVLFAEVLRLLGDVNDRHVGDLFAGAGPIALRLGKAGARVTAIERQPGAVRDGIAAAHHNGLGRQVRFLAADAFVGLHQVDAEGLDALVVDPPRKGLDEDLVELLCDLRFRRMVYVSCNPLSLVRDLARLAVAFRTRVLRPVDLFPRTEHLEAVALLERR